MDKNNQHIIDKITAELTVSSQKSQREISEQLKKAIRSALEKIRRTFDKNYSDSFYRIDYLNVEIDLKEDDLDRLDQIVEREILKNIIRAEVKEISSEPFPDNRAAEIVEVTPEKRARELVIYFIETGRFPWWATKEPFSAIEEWIHKISKRQWQDILKPLVAGNARYMQRLSMQLPEPALMRLVKHTAGEILSKQVLKLIDEVDQFVESRKLAYGVSRQVRTRLYQEALTGFINETSYEILSAHLVAAALDTMNYVGKPANKITTDDWVEWSGMSVINNKDILHVHKKMESAGSSNTGTQKTEESFLEDVEFSVANAGLVLLHPFWQLFFENLGLTENGRFIDEPAKERALCLLHYLATGREDFAEHDLVLPKFLCGWPLSQPVNRFLPLSPYEKEESAALLESAINHWGVLKSTSPKALQSNYLHRRGVLKKEVFGWSLYVEQKTQDVLLEKLPWSISVVKHPWMDDMLTVHW